MFSLEKMIQRKRKSKHLQNSFEKIKEMEFIA